MVPVFCFVLVWTYAWSLDIQVVNVQEGDQLVLKCAGQANKSITHITWFLKDLQDKAITTCLQHDSCNPKCRFLKPCTGRTNLTKSNYSSELILDRVQLSRNNTIIHCVMGDAVFTNSNWFFVESKYHLNVFRANNISGSSKIIATQAAQVHSLPLLHAPNVNTESNSAIPPIADSPAFYVLIGSFFLLGIALFSLFGWVVWAKRNSWNRNQNLSETNNYESISSDATGTTSSSASVESGIKADMSDESYYSGSTSQYSDRDGQTHPHKLVDTTAPRSPSQYSDRNEQTHPHKLVDTMAPARDTRISPPARKGQPRPHVRLGNNYERHPPQEKEYIEPLTPTADRRSNICLDYPDGTSINETQTKSK